MVGDRLLPAFLLLLLPLDGFFLAEEEDAGECSDRRALPTFVTGVLGVRMV